MEEDAKAYKQQLKEASAVGSCGCPLGGRVLAMA